MIPELTTDLHIGQCAGIIHLFAGSPNQESLQNRLPSHISCLTGDPPTTFSHRSFSIQWAVIFFFLQKSLLPHQRITLSTSDK